MGQRAVKRGENELNKNGSLLNPKQTTLEPIKILHESVPFFKLNDALISGYNFRCSRYSSNVIAAVITIQQITYLIVWWTESILHRLRSSGVSLKWSTETDGQKDSDHQPPGLIHRGKTSALGSVFLHSNMQAWTRGMETHSAVFLTHILLWHIDTKCKAMQNIQYIFAKEVGLYIMKLKRLTCCNIPGVHS